MIKVYTASKLDHFPKWRKLREQYPTLCFNARWIEQEHLQAEINAQAVQQSSTLPNDLATQVWIEDIDDVMEADYCIVYAEDGEHLRGALVEAGAAIAAGKGVIVVGNHRDYGTWQHHPRVARVATIEDAIQYIFDDGNNFELAGRTIIMTLETLIAEIESQIPKYRWLIRSEGEGYIANVYEDVDLNTIPRANLERYRSFGTGSTPEEALTEAFRLAKGKRVIND